MRMTTTQARCSSDASSIKLIAARMHMCICAHSGTTACGSFLSWSLGRGPRNEAALGSGDQDVVKCTCASEADMLVGRLIEVLST